MTNGTGSMARRLALVGAIASIVGCGEPPGNVKGDEDTVAVSGALQPDEVTIGPAGEGMNYYACAQDFGTCVVGGLRYMAYGANGTYFYKLTGGTVPCTPATFGGDPLPGVVKTCYISNYGSAGNLPAPLFENQTGNFSGNVAFGANGAFFFKTVNGPFTCNNATFQDPISGVAKACYFAVPQFTRIAAEGAPMTNLPYNSLVAFGAGGRFVFGMLTGIPILATTPNNNHIREIAVTDISCSPGTFGGVDPAVGVVKDCYQIVNGQLATVPAKFFAAGGQPWTNTTGASTNLFYGDARNGNVMVVSASGTTDTCGNGLGDPDLGTVKYCWGAPFPTGQGTWTAATNSFPGTAPLFAQLLMDGSVLVQDHGTPANWYRLVPDATLGYSGGTWVGPIVAHFGRVGFASAMLSDGRLFAGGGEYVFNPDNTPVDPAAPGGGCSPTGCIKHSTCELFDPLASSWTSVPDYPNSTYLGDGLAAPLANGRLLVGAPGPGSMIFDPAKIGTTGGPWGGTANLPTPPPYFGEGSFALLQDDRVFLAEDHGAIYSSGSGLWTKWDQWPVMSPFDNDVGEGASALTLYSGKVFITSASGHNAIFNPHVTGSASLESAVDTPDVPFSATPASESPPSAAESFQVVLPTGNLLLAVAKSYSNYKFYEYNTPTNTFHDVSLGAPSLLGNREVIQTLLPDGRVLVGDTMSKSIYVYTPQGAQLTSFGAPHITSISGPVSGVYTLMGTGLNGLTNGANSDDEGQNFTAFPVVFFTVNGQTRYAHVRSVSNRSIAPNASVTVKFSLPTLTGIPHGTQLTVFVSGSGLKSTNSKTITF